MIRLDPIHPGDILKHDFMDPSALSATALARAIGVTPARVNEIVRRRRGITAETALRLARYFNTDAQSWMNLQARYELALAERDDRGRTASHSPARRGVTARGGCVAAVCAASTACSRQPETEVPAEHENRKGTIEGDARDRVQRRGPLFQVGPERADGPHGISAPTCCRSPWFSRPPPNIYARGQVGSRTSSHATHKHGVR